LPRPRLEHRENVDDDDGYKHDANDDRYDQSGDRRSVGLDRSKRRRLRLLVYKPKTNNSAATAEVADRDSQADLYLKEKERKSIYIAPFCTKVHTKRSGMNHTVVPANNTMPAFPS